jgi:hypothetical protein
MANSRSRGGIFAHAAGQVTRSLDEIHAVPQGVDEARDGFRVVLVIAIDGDDARIALVEGEGIGAAELGAEFAGAGFDQQTTRTLGLEYIRFQLPVGTAAIHDQDICSLGDAKGLHSVKQLADAFAFVDDRDHHAPGMTLTPP